MAVATLFVVAALSLMVTRSARSRLPFSTPLTQSIPVPPQLELISKADPNQSSATAGALMTNQRCFSADGRYVVFESGSENLVDGQVDDHGTNDIFLHDRVTGSTVLVTHAAGSPTTAASDSSFVPSISADGRLVVYWSFASDIVAGQNDTNQTNPDVFLYDRVTGTNTLVSHIPGSHHHRRFEFV
jgi:Tol biopolymer transport system component